eukprot:gnl/MRDRNA2_/MRDRNA2_156449_c0_seq1.p1 gnl/MRDRNA2_/MRDRNA2_156449_c0~~gnl/MRDRNA2_/MRDRNA2_156449_c0_seq1.p1  ORF type:complete len:553 (+),score=93.58 gnl/MRDRNA2_/MRDRNA2_156449_c0_seq1:69-1727(+)
MVIGTWEMAGFVWGTLMSNWVLATLVMTTSLFVFRKQLDKALAYIITYHRGVFSLFLLMPISLIVNVVFWCVNRIDMWSPTSNISHKVKINQVQEQVKAWIRMGKKTKLCTARAGWKTMSLRVGKYKATHTGIEVSHLRSVVHVDEKKETVLLEPNVTMGQATATLNPLGWTLPVVPELDDLTVGGLVCGVGVESSSHKHGLFQHSCVAFELVTADGEYSRITAEDDPDLFRSIPWSYGTLGFLVGVEVKIMRIKPFVKLTYAPHYSRDSAVKCFRQAAADENIDFLETLAFAPDAYVQMDGVLVDADEAYGDEDGKHINPIGHWYKPWFFTHVRSFLACDNEKQHKDAVIAHEYIPLRDYYHRHTRSLFWEIQDIVTFGNHWLFRYTLGWLMPPNISLMKRTQTEELRKLYEEHHVVQDMLVPVSTLDEALGVFDAEFNVYPLWICPMRVFEADRGFIAPTKDGEEMFVDIGAYGVPQAPKFNHVSSLRQVEAFVRKVQGYQMLYADTHLTREEFREMFHHDLYDEMRNRLAGCKEAFPEVFDKVCKAARL